MPSLIDLLRGRLATLLPSELRAEELVKLLLPHRHSMLLTQRRATLIVNRVRLLAFLFAVLTPIWGLVDLMVFPYPLWLSLVTFRLLACAAFACLLLLHRPNGSLYGAYRAVACLFAIPTLFYIASHTLLGGYQLTELSTVAAAGYAFLPLLLMAGLAIFPLTLLENAVLASALLLAQAVAAYLSWATLDWPSFAAVFWLALLIAGVTALASLSQLAFMIVLVRQAIRDPLTGTFARASGQEILQLQWDTSRRHDTGLAVALLDLDHFKAINHRFGHEAGDAVLREFGRHLLATLRSTDSVLRWGGEAFVIIMPDTDMDQARLVLDRMVRRGLGGRPDGTPLTASIGLAERCRDFTESSAELMALADRRMHLAKASGRNRLCTGGEDGTALAEPPSHA
ncbi:diguanylate cyclase [Stutzerimonas marianensis]|uniref:GGDEF domain-containing protein n=1 Tax=Stutzerimonas marianensis TaxID=2929513 RepID=UPI003C2C423C